MERSLTQLNKKKKKKRKIKTNKENVMSRIKRLYLYVYQRILQFFFTFLKLARRQTDRKEI